MTAGGLLTSKRRMTRRQGGANRGAPQNIHKRQAAELDFEALSEPSSLRDFPATESRSKSGSSGQTESLLTAIGGAVFSGFPSGTAVKRTILFALWISEMVLIPFSS